MTKRLPHPPLLVITDRQQARRPVDDILTASFAAGCRWASVREKDLPPGEQLALAQRLLTLARDWNAWLTLHGDPALAREAGLDGVHLAAGADVSAARRTMGKSALIGVSVHTAEEAAKLDPALVDYLIAGPAYATDSKPGYGPVLGMVGIGKISEATSVPIIAIGGITPGAVADMHIAGAVGIAVMGSVMRAEQPKRELERLIAAVAPDSL